MPNPHRYSSTAMDVLQHGMSVAELGASYVTPHQTPTAGCLTQQHTSLALMSSLAQRTNVSFNERTNERISCCRYSMPNNSHIFDMTGNEEKIR